MIYRDFCGDKISMLAFGGMRFPTVGDDTNIDEEKTAELISYAMEHGINYYDTAWGYHGGNSEPVLGKILSRYPRDRYKLATKFPGYNLSNMDKVRQIFESQLERCRVEYFDFYLFHNVCETNINEYLDPKYGIYDYLTEQRKNGRIRRLGFSAHGSVETIKRFLDAYGDAMEFCQLQINYLDYTFQDGKEKMELLESRGIPIWVMEPLRGGKLALPDEKYLAELASVRPGEGPVALAFRFLQAMPQVVTVLSGMSNMDQLSENIRIFSEDNPLDACEIKSLLGVADKMLHPSVLPCTSCRYCVSECPQELNIPELISLYNEHSFSGGGFIAPMRLSAMPKNKHPSACIGCGSCDSVCPQQIKISEVMADFAEKLR